MNTIAPTATGSGRVVIDIPAKGDAAIRATAHRGTPFELTVETTVTADQARQMCAAIADLLETPPGRLHDRALAR